MASRQVKELPLSVIIGATNGDEAALTSVLDYYRDYIRCLAMRTVKDEYGNEYVFVDEDRRLRLETKLLCSIIKNFKILPA